MSRLAAPGPDGGLVAPEQRSRYSLGPLPVLYLAVLLIAACNLTFRLDRDAITEWDESLYALSAAEMIESNDWIATRLLGQIDYYNAKPPLNVWLIALSFKTLGMSAFSLRLVSVVSAGLTILALVWWMQSVAGIPVALVSGLVLATSFGFVYVHSARTANTDALYTFLILLTAVVLHRSVERRWSRLWLGPLLAAAFLLRGPAVLMLLAIIALFELWNRRARGRWMPLACAAMLFAIPSGLWMFARWRVDQWQFIEQLWSIDLVARTLSPLENHAGTPLFYLNVLQKYQYEWLLAGAIALMLYPPSRQQWNTWLAFPGAHERAKAVLACWGIVALIVPTIMQTKVAWYLNPFYPVFAVTVAMVLCRAAEIASIKRGARAAMLLLAVFIATVAAEGKLLYQSLRRDADRSLQGFLQSEAAVLAGHTVFRRHWNHAERFVVTRLIGAEIERLHRDESFTDESEPGDFLVTTEELPDSRLEKVGQRGSLILYVHKPEYRKRLGSLTCAERDRREPDQRCNGAPMLH
jgi:4-amino-4-deoxy-L-arabinose transferase-like glycosyltransferase